MQIADAFAEINGAAIQRVKLYNASNFFDRHAVPPMDLPRIAELCAPFSGVTVESHASTVGTSALELARRLPGRLEVAMGLETIHPTAAPLLNKRLDVERFDRAASFLTEHDIDVRVFVLLGAPGVRAEETVEWTVRTVSHAANNGATVVSIIPVRGGNGEMERLAALRQFTPPTLSHLEAALEASQGHRGTVVTVDLWDVDRLAGCSTCRAARTERLRRMNVTGEREPAVVCAACDSP